MNRQILGVAAAGLLLIAIPAHAVPTLTLSFTVDGVAQPACLDNSSCDVNPLEGAVTFSGTLPGGYIVNVTTGVSKPIFDDGTPLMHLDSVNVQNTGGTHDLVITLSDSGFTFTGGYFSGALGGVLTSGTGASISASAYYDAGAGAVLIGEIGPFGPGAFSGTMFGGPGPNSPYSLSEVLTLHTVGASSFSSNLEISVPEPTTVALLGVGLGLLGFGMRRRQLQS
jgi:hypothetical protein